MSRARTAGVLWALALAGSPAAAEEESQEAKRAPALVSFKRAACIYTACFLEPFIPDLRYEFGGAAEDGWVWSLPIHPWATRPLDVPGPTLILSPFIEPQLRLKPSRLRMLAGARVYGFPDTARLGALVEGAGVWGSDGKGGVLGVGVTYDLLERHPHTQPWTVSLVGRRTWTGREARYDVSLDITVPLRMLFGSPIETAEAMVGEHGPDISRAAVRREEGDPRGLH